jgi:hypothetical protein
MHVMARRTYCIIRKVAGPQPQSKTRCLESFPNFYAKSRGFPTLLQCTEVFYSTQAGETPEGCCGNQPIGCLAMRPFESMNQRSLANGLPSSRAAIHSA